jgi:4-amino-4-deoxy-L-arabinose transferase-like glycosyltransferase
VLISILIIVSIIALIKLLSPQYGLVGRYYVGTNWEGEPLHTQIDPNISFKNDILLRSVYTLNWDLDKFPFPEQFPQYSVEWKGFIKVPGVQGGKYETQSGFVGRYYHSIGFSGKPFLTDADSRVSFAWKDDGEKPYPVPFSIEWNGYISIPRDGEYRFATESDDGSWVYIDGKLVVDNGGAHPPIYKSGSMNLAAGDHRIIVRYFESGGGAFMRLLWTPPGEAEKPIPKDVIYHFKNGYNKYALAVESNSGFQIYIDNEAIFSNQGQQLAYSKELKPGAYPISIRFANNDGKGKIVLYWKLSDGREVIVPRGAFYPTKWEFTNIARKRIVGILLVLTFGLFIWVSLRRKGRVYLYLYEYTNFVSSKRVSFALAFILLMAAFLRFHQYNVVPFHIETADEFNNGWIGWNIIHRGMPSGWSWAPPYSGRPIRYWFGNPFRIAEPAFHPSPLFPIIVGIAASLGGARHAFEVSLTYLRLPPIILTVLTTLLVFVLSKKLYNEKVALLASLLYATIPIVVVSGRLTKEENLLAFLFLLATLSTLKYLDTPKQPRYLYLAAIVAGLSFLTKPTGLCVVGVVSILLAYHRKWKEIARVVPICLGIVSLYFIYGWWYDWDLFISVFKYNTSLFTRMDVGIRFLQESKIVEKWIGGGWVIWLWLSTIYMSVKKDRVIPIAAIVYLLTLSISVNANLVYGWYMIPLYPFLCIAGGLFLYDLFRKPELFKSIIFILTGLMLSLQYYFSQGLALSSRLAVASMVAPFFLYVVFRNKLSLRLARLALYILFALFTVVNIMIVLNFMDIYPSL